MNTNGTHDLSFRTDVGDQFSPGAVNDIALQSNGKILIGGGFNVVNDTTRNNFARLNVDGTLDTTVNTNFNGSVLTVELQADGKILTGGSFSTVNSQSYADIARLNSDGTLETAFHPLLNNAVGNILIQPDGKILASGDFTNINGQTRNKIARFSPNGALDDFNAGSGPNFTIYNLARQADGKILLVGTFTSVNGQTRNRIARVYENGALDATLNPNIIYNGTINFPTIQTIVRQPDGKILIGGVFTSVGGQPFNKIVRLNLDGTRDTTFNSPFLTATNQNHVMSIAVQPDGKIIIGGNFIHDAQQGTMTGVKRLNADGSFDTTFNRVLLDTVRAILLLPDGSMLVGGPFNYGIPSSRPFVVKLFSDGTTDLSFNPAANLNASNTNGVANDGGVTQIIRQPDGRIIIGGFFVFTNNSSIYLQNMARINTNGTFDLSFNPRFLPGGGIYAMTQQSDGKILIGGIGFNSINSVPRINMARLSANGVVDTSFDALANTNAEVRAIATQADGKILVGGNFTNIGGQPRSAIARLNSDGTADSFIVNNGGSSGGPYSIVVQPDGKILVGGSFGTMGGQPRNNIARLTNDTPSAQTLSVTTTTVSLTLAGAGPQLSRVIFEQSTDGVNYTLLGEATGSSSSLAAGKANEGKMLLAPTATTFTLSGLNLPTTQNLFIRARGFDASGSETTGTALNTVLLAPTAATISIAGRVLIPQDFGLTNALVTLTDMNGNAQTVRTGKFGSFRFTDVAAGETYILNVSAKRYTYAPRIITATQNLTELSITPQ